MAVNKGLGYEAYKEAYDRLGSVRAVARELSVNPSTVQRCLRNNNQAASQSRQKTSWKILATR
jgi:DNA-binding transcriptional regulator YhcF (GntR family)